MRVAEAITLSPDERAVLDKWAAGGSFPYRLVQRARIIRMAADGALSQDIARTLRISRPTVQLWRQRFLALRIAGLEKDAPRPGSGPEQRHHSSNLEATQFEAPFDRNVQAKSRQTVHRKIARCRGPLLEPSRQSFGSLRRRKKPDSSFGSHPTSVVPSRFRWKIVSPISMPEKVLPQLPYNQRSHIS